MSAGGRGGGTHSHPQPAAIIQDGAQIEGEAGESPESLLLLLMAQSVGHPGCSFDVNHCF